MWDIFLHVSSKIWKNFKNGVMHIFFRVPVPVPVCRYFFDTGTGTGKFGYRSIPGYRTMKWETGRRQWLFLQPSCYGYVISMVQDNGMGDGTTSVTVFAAELLRVRHIYGTGQWSGRRDDVSDCFCCRVVTGTSYLWYRTMKWETGRRQWLFLQPSCYGYVISMVQDNEVGDRTTSVTVFAAELLRVRHIYGTGQWSGRRDDVSDCFCSRVVTGTSYLWYRTMKWETGRRQWLFLQPSCYGYVISMAEDNEVGDGTTSVTVFAAELLRVRHIYGTGQWSGRRDEVSDCFCSRVVTGTSYLWYRTMKWETGTTSVTVFAAEMLRVRHIYGTGQWSGRRDDVSDCFCSRVVTGTSYLWYMTMKWETGRRQWLFLQPSCYGYVISMVQDNEVGDGTTSVTVFAAELLRVRHIYGTGQWSGRRDDVSDCFCSRVVTGTS